MKPSHFDTTSIDLVNRQLRKATMVVLVVFIALLLRLWFLQVVNGFTYRTKSESNRIRLQDIQPFRGMIFDRDGVVLAGNRPCYDLYVIPEEIQNRGALLDDLNRLVGLDSYHPKEKLALASNRRPFKPICLKRDIPRDELVMIETHRFNLPGVMINVKPQRHYIYQNFASHLLGYLGQINEKQLGRKPYSGNKPGDLVGKSGVESQWQAALNGMRGGKQVEVDAAGRIIRVIARRPPISGANVTLTIHWDLQGLAEKALKGKKGAIVALNPMNGEILALASSPSYDPNLFIGGIDQPTWDAIVTSGDFPLQNRALGGQYPPGSVFKIVVALAGLQEGLIDEDEEIFCNGLYFLGRQKYRCWKKHGHGKVALHQALVESCDVYFYKLGKRIGVDKIAHYAKMLGLGRPTGLDLGQEKGGLVPTSQWKLQKIGIPWQTGETISMSIGQSFVLVTPIQVANLISAVFNGGIIYKPQVTQWVGNNGNKNLFAFKPQIAGKLAIDPAHLDFVKNALTGVVHERRGTGGRARVKDVFVAGKTGTAQVVALSEEEKTGNEEEIPMQFRDHAWFTAIAPADDPKIALAIIVEHGGHGGSAAAPIAKTLIQAYLKGS